jgi:flagellar assembly factor FliW
VSGEGTIVVEHRRFGRLEIPEPDVLQFDPLPGFPSARRFALLAHDRAEVFAWLVCLDDPGLAFVVTDPWQFFPDYDPGLPEVLLEGIGAKRREDVELLVLVSLREGQPTLNLLAPLVLCAPARRGAQWILDDARHSACQPLPPLERPREDSAKAQIESKPQR